MIGNSVEEAPRGYAAAGLHDQQRIVRPRVAVQTYWYVVGFW